MTVVGRVIHLRNTGKLCFARLREGDGTELQVMLSLADLGEEALAEFKALVDIGDFLAVTGEVITSRRGELSVQATRWEMAAKALRRCPTSTGRCPTRRASGCATSTWSSAPAARDGPHQGRRAEEAPRTLDDRGYVEVETPILQLTNGGAAARPFRTHLNAFDQEMLLRIALELDLKKAMIGGVDKVYEIGRTFRNEGLDSTHAAEFSMLEAYEAYGDVESTKELAATSSSTPRGRSDGRSSPARDGRNLPGGPVGPAGILALVSEQVGGEVAAGTRAEELQARRAHEVELQPQWNAGEIVLELYEQLVEHTLLQPTFVQDYPESVRPLAKPHRSKPGLVEAFDLIIDGVELAPAYTELNDPVIQRERLTEQSLLAAQGDPEAMDLDESFLRAMEHGMPPAGGIGLGVDRLIMLLTGAGIRETILFPLLRPE